MNNNPKDLLEQYETSLSDLRQNSKPMISCLTILAEENIIVAEGIVQLIENRLYRVPNEQKLVYLYLVDSICKNIGKEYVKLFAKHLVKNFCHVFETGDEKVRANLYKMRQTWKALFSHLLLYQIDINVKKLDPAWPVTAKLETTDAGSNQTEQEVKISQQIHVNPDFKRSLEDKDERQFKVKKLDEIEQSPVNHFNLDSKNNKRPLEDRSSSSPDSKRSPNSWNNLISSDLKSVNNNISDLNSQLIDSQQKHQFLNHSSFPNSSTPIPGLTNSIVCPNASNQSSLSSQPLSSIQPSIVQQPSIVSSIQPNLTHQPSALHFVNANPLPPTSLNNLTTSLPAQNVFNHQLPNLSTLNSLNSFNLPATSKDVDYRITNQQSLPAPNSIFNTFNEHLLNAQQQNQLMNLGPEELKLQVNGDIRKLFYLDDHVAVVLMNCLVDLPFDQLKHISPAELDPRLINFDGQPVNVYIDEKDAILLPFNNQWKLFYHNGFEQKIKFGGPAREIYLNNQVIQAKFGGPCVLCKLNGDLRDHTLRLDIPAPKVKLSDQPRVDLWIQILQKYSIPNPLNNPLNLSNLKPPFQLTPMQAPPAISAIKQQQPIVMRQPVINSTIAQPPQSTIPPQTLPQFMIPSPNQFFTPSTANTIPLINDQQPMINHEQAQQQQKPHNVKQQEQKHAANDSETETRKTTKSNRNRKSRGQKEEAKKEPVLEFKPESLKIKRQSLIDSLYSGAQCTNCSLRFANKTEKGKSKYSAHLDWHFRKNRKIRGNNFKTSNLNRDWYLPLDLWLKFKEINIEEDNDKMQNGQLFEMNNQMSNKDEHPDQTPLPLIKANSDDSLNSCSICYERFNQIWCDDEEEWKLENAVSNEDKYYHPTCLTDMLNKSIEEEATLGEETILRISDSILEDYEPPVGGDTNIENKQLENLTIKEENESEFEDKKLIEQEDDERNKMQIDQSIKDEILRELNEESQNADAELDTRTPDTKVDESTLVRKTVLNVFEVNQEEEMETSGEVKKEDCTNESSNECTNESHTAEQAAEQDLKVEIIGLDIAKTDVEADELANDAATKPVTETVKKVELVQPAKKDLKPILLKLNIKESNLANSNQRKTEVPVNSPKSDSNSKSPISNNQPEQQKNGVLEPRDDVIYRGREESALCSIM